MLRKKRRLRSESATIEQQRRGCHDILIISKQAASAYQEQGLAALRQKIIARWRRELSESATTAGEGGRNSVLDGIAQLSREDPDLTEGELMMLADLRIVEVANQARARAD